MTDHITLPRSVVERAIEATGVLLRMIRRDAPYLSGKAMGIAETCNDALLGALAGAAQAEPVAVPEEMSPEFTDTARSALLWVLWHHQGGSSKVGQPIRFALGMGQHEHLNAHQVTEAKRWGELNATPTPPAATVPVLEPLTDDEVDRLWSDQPLTVPQKVQRRFIARAVEAAHAAKLAKRGGV